MGLAGTGARIEVLGLKELKRELRKAGSDFTELKALHRRVGQQIANYARAEAPVGIRRSPGDSTLPGALRDSIRPNALRYGVVVSAGNNSKIRYGAPIHWGWLTRPGVPKGSKTGRYCRGGAIRPNAFITRAAQEKEPKWLREYEREIYRILDQVKGHQRP